VSDPSEDACGARSMCNSPIGLPEVKEGSCGADTVSVCAIDAVPALLLGGKGGGARFSPASAALICWGRVLGTDSGAATPFFALSAGPLGPSDSDLDRLAPSRGSS
jgi:hypothetical protein